MTIRTWSIDFSDESTYQMSSTPGVYISTPRRTDQVGRPTMSQARPIASPRRRITTAPLYSLPATESITRLWTSTAATELSHGLRATPSQPKAIKNDDVERELEKLKRDLKAADKKAISMDKRVKYWEDLAESFVQQIESQKQQIAKDGLLNFDVMQQTKEQVNAHGIQIEGQKQEIEKEGQLRLDTTQQLQAQLDALSKRVEIQIASIKARSQQQIDALLQQIKGQAQLIDNQALEIKSQSQRIEGQDQHIRIQAEEMKIQAQHNKNLLASIDELVNKEQKLRKTVDEHHKRIDNCEEIGRDRAADIGQLGMDIDGLGGQLDVLREDVDEQGKSQTAELTKVKTLSSERSDKHESKLQKLEKKVDKLVSRLDEHDSEMSEVHDRMEDLQDEVWSLESDLEDVKNVQSDPSLYGSDEVDVKSETATLEEM